MVEGPDGKPWAVLSDPAKFLGYGLTTDAAKILKDHQKGKQKVHTLGGDQEVLIVSEGGLNRLIMRSSQPDAE